jgi:ElaB/YqjD/DUF883 family membrane-anchored ribosome-binding protein
MSHQNDEVERLKRIRDRQIGLRDPQTKQQRIQHGIAKRRQKAVKKFSTREVMREIPHKAKGTIIGAVIGILILVLLPMFVESEWTDIIGIMSIVLLSIFGFLFGRALDTRDSLKELIGE